ncbi:hypothetical protein VP01_2621g2 [Puccinia sorghi]|uniref:Uncharacterized protein n=1 Tax=Puccinia sorghi TaxID=27349 RepID=A0A0L6V4H1_9BASI|nr:hypothetical protein VP01_2621g2 [Puccinia sorghi]
MATEALLSFVQVTTFFFMVKQCTLSSFAIKYIFLTRKMKKTRQKRKTRRKNLYLFWRMKMNLIMISIVMILTSMNMTWLKRMRKWRHPTIIWYKPLLRKKEVLQTEINCISDQFRAFSKDNCKLGHFKEIHSLSNNDFPIQPGDGPTRAFSLPNYYQIISYLKAKDRALEREDALHPTYFRMIEKLEAYREEVLIFWEAGQYLEENHKPRQHFGIIQFS